MGGSLDHRARVHAALADPVRLGIVDELALSDRSPAELAARFSVRSNLLAHHLDALEAAGLIERMVSRGDRRRRYVRLVPDGFAGLMTVPQWRASGVVFVCTQNAARSQLAAAMWNALSPVEGTSAGTQPADRVHPGAVRVARRRGLDLSGVTPRRLRLDELRGRVVVTVCDLAHEALVAITGAVSVCGPPVLHWSIPDPADPGRRADFELAADVIDHRVRELAASVVPA